MPDINWYPVVSNPPPAPGQYLTRRTLRIKPGKNGLREITYFIVAGRFDGQRFELVVQPEEWRAMPEGSR